MPIKPKEKSLDEKKKDVITDSVNARGYKKGGMAQAKMMAGGGMMKKGYAAGGMPMTMKDGKRVPTFAADGKGAMAKGGTAKAKMMAGGGMAKSKMASSMGKVPTGKPAMGSASKRADGIAMKGKTRGMEVKMAKGGKS